MKRNSRFLFAITALALAALACQALSGGGQDTPPVDVISTVPPVGVQPTAESIIPPIFGGSDVILSDDFSDTQWGTGTDADSSVEYINETLQFIVFTDNYFVWSTPDAEDYSNVHIEVTALNNSTDPDTAFGIICSMQITNVSYYFAVTLSGQYAIAKSMVALDDVFLTNDDAWADSDLIPQNASSYRVGADCGGDGTLTLYVNGRQIDSVNDTDYGSGNVALFTWSADEPAGANISFDDFEMKELP
ncbi:MAG TPA: hypothetical protein VMJ90_07115 [Anaerolineales bacterium]|nr:hypothetical protein [Anaerolineales bacterium]